MNLNHVVIWYAHTLFLLGNLDGFNYMNVVDIIHSMK